MRTFEGTLHVKPHKNLFGKKTPLTIDCETKEALKIEINRIKKEFLVEGNYRVYIELRERK